MSTTITIRVIPFLVKSRSTSGKIILVFIENRNKRGNPFRFGEDRAQFSALQVVYRS